MSSFGDFCAGLLPYPLVQRLDFVDSTYGTTQGLTVPSTAKTGDIIIFFNVGGNSTATPPTAAVPSGFSQINTSNPAGRGWRGVLSWNQTNTNFSGVSLTGMTANLSYENCLLVLRPSYPATVTIGDAAQAGTGGDPATQTVNCFGVTDPCVVIAAYRNETTGTSRTMSPSEDGSSDLFNAQLKYKIYNIYATDTTVDLNDTGNINLLHSCYLTITK